MITIILSLKFTGRAKRSQSNCPIKELKLEQRNRFENVHLAIVETLTKCFLFFDRLLYF